jgi:histidinol-phosphate/aromatic aminotransferase/cobyric acid decarboxylase-like protein
MLISDLIKQLQDVFDQEGDIQVVIDPIQPSTTHVVVAEGAEPIYVKPTDNPMVFSVDADAREGKTVKVVYIW